MPRTPTPSNANHNEDKQILSVSNLARSARLLLEERFASVWVEGELSNFSRPRSGHWYFTLKDEQAQIRCAMFASRNRAVRHNISEGMTLLVRGRVSLYEGRGDFQVIVEHLEPAGEGALRAAFDALKAKLFAEGLFETENKRALPEHPQRLLIVTSATGAALRDVLHVIERRFPALAVVLDPVAVQGDGAERDICNALSRVTPGAYDAVLLTRGGGSLEDLWAFNLESVARAIFDCPVPVVSAIGHQTDITIADFVADLRAPTPSAAAELITPDAAAIAHALRQAQARLTQLTGRRLQLQQQHVIGLRRRLIDPSRALAQRNQRVDELEQRVQRRVQQRLRDCGRRLQHLAARLQQLSPAAHIARRRERLRELNLRAQRAAQIDVQRKRRELQAALRPLTALNPLQTLTRGYAVLLQDGSAVESIEATATGADLTAYLTDGALQVTVTQTLPGATPFAVDLQNPDGTPNDRSPSNS